MSTRSVDQPRRWKEAGEARQKRQHRRYALAGQAVFRTAKAVEARACSLNIGIGGILLRSPVIPPEGTELWLHLALEDRPEAFFITRGRIVRTEPDGLAVIFLEQPAGLESMLRSLGVPANQGDAAPG